MKRGTFIATIATAFSATGLTVGLMLATSAGASAAVTGNAAVTRTATVQAGRQIVLDCSGRPVTRPSTYSWTCADYGMGIQRMHWTSWTSHLASGYGTMWENDCTPNCAAGHIRHYAAIATFWGSARVNGHPAERRYTRLTLVFPGRRPPVYVRVNGKVRKTYPVTQTFRI